MIPHMRYCSCTGLAFPLKIVIVKITMNFMIAAFFQPFAFYSQPLGLFKKVVALLNNVSFLLNLFLNADRYHEIYASLIIIYNTHEKKLAMDSDNYPAIGLTVNQ
jgi:hypothetical protein